MSDAEELHRLAELHQRGLLSDAEFSQAKAKLLGAAPAAAPFASANGLNELRRSRDDRWLGGVCGGLARITGLESWVWRLLFALLVLCVGTGLFVYLLLWIFVPQD